MSPTRVDFEVRKDDLLQGRRVERPEPALEDGEVRLAIDQVALTANNVSYAVFGDRFDYWSFFPAADGWGRVPAWGFANVAESRHPGLAEGERIFGFLPLSATLTVRPGPVDDSGFSDVTEHRRSLHGVYNRYARCSGDPGYQADGEAEQMIFRPLFMTAFLIDDLLDDSDGFGARQLLLSSASSKTAFSLAHLAAARGVDVTGLTSPGHRAFVEGLGCYARVLGYDDLETLDPDCDTVYVDFAGHSALRSRIHGYFGHRLRYSSMVGGAHWQDVGDASDLPGPTPTLFFAPDRIRQRYRDWGAEGLAARYGAAWSGFLGLARRAVQVDSVKGWEALDRTWRALVAGQVPPDIGPIATLND